MRVHFTPGIVFVQEPYVHGNQILVFGLTDLDICTDVDSKCAIVIFHS